MSDFRQQQEAEESRSRYALEILGRMVDHGMSSADVLWTAHEFGVARQFEQDIQRKAA